MRFSGPAPEVINGRLAMLGFDLAVLVELLTGDTIFQQVYNEITILVTVTLTVFTASMVPLYRGVRVSPDSFLNFKNELLNGRVAMMGLFVMMIIEAITGSAIFVLD